MTSNTTKTISKVAAIVAASALVAMSVVIAPAAHADTTTTTTMTSSQVTALQAEIASLQAQLAAAAGTSTTATVTFTTDLTIGSTGASVTALQTWLIAKGYSIPAGATGYFGAQTQAALAAYQAAVGITPAVGYFGPITRAQVNASAGTTTTTTTTTGTTTAGCVAGAAYSSTTGQACSTTTTGSTTLSGGEGSIDNFKTVGASSTSFNAGDTEQVYGFEFKADGSDLQVNRVDYDVSKTSTGTGSVRPWNVLQTATLMDGTNVIATEDATNQNNWSEDGTNGQGNQIYRIRFDNLNDVVKMGNTADFYLSFTSQNAVSDSNAGATYSVGLTAQGLRATDAMGIQQYTSASTPTASSFSVSSATNGSAVLSQGSDNPQTTTVQGNQSSQTSGVVLNTFTLQAKTADLELYTLPVTVTTNTSTTTLNPGVIIRDLKLYQGSTLLDTESPSSSMTSGQTLNFTNLDFKIPAGTTDSFSIQADINKIDGNTVPEGSNVMVSITPTNISNLDLENSTGDSLANATTGGSTGNTITFRSIGLSADASPSTSATATLSSAGAGTAQTGTFTFTFNVTAFGQDIFLASTSAAYGGSNNGTYGLVIYDYSAGNIATTSALISSSLTSTADRTTSGTNNYVIHSGQTKQVTVSATVQNGKGDYYYAVLKNLYFGSADSGTATTSSITLPTSYQTGQVRIAS